MDMSGQLDALFIDASDEIKIKLLIINSSLIL